MDISELLDKKKDLVNAANEHRAATFEDNWKTKDDEERFDALLAEAEQVSGEIDRQAKLDKLQRSLDDEPKIEPRKTQSQLSPRSSSTGTPTGLPTSEERALALQAWCAVPDARAPELITERHREAAERCGVNLNAKSMTFRLAREAPTMSDVRDNFESWEKRIVVDVTDPGGGHFSVPDQMQRPLERALLAFGGMRQVSQILRTDTGADLPYPTNDDTANTGGLVGEGIEHVELDLTLSQIVFNAYKFTSFRVPMSWEYLQDNAINASQVIGSMLGERIGRAQNNFFTTGTGAGQPNGVVTGAAASGITLAANQPTYDELIEVKHSVDAAYRELSPRWMFNDQMLKEIKKIKGGANLEPLWRPGLAANVPDTIDGDPYTVNQSMSVPGTGNITLLYGAFEKYVIRETRDVQLLRLDERYAELGLVAFLAWARADGDIVQPNAIKSAVQA